MLTPLQPIPEAVSPESLWDVIRRANSEDLVNVERLDKESVPRAKKACRELIQKLSLQMKVTDVDYVYGGERLIFYFTSETRVDFRELVRLLAHEFRTRIELEQVGARDEARLVGDAGHCGLTLAAGATSRSSAASRWTWPRSRSTRPTRRRSRAAAASCSAACATNTRPTRIRATSCPSAARRLESKKGGVGIVVDQNLLLRRSPCSPPTGATASSSSSMR